MVDRYSGSGVTGVVVRGVLLANLLLVLCFLTRLKYGEYGLRSEGCVIACTVLLLHYYYCGVRYGSVTLELDNERTNGAAIQPQ